MASDTLRNRLKWRREGDGFGLFYAQRTKPLLHVVPDKTYAGMFRVKHPNGSLSDLGNLTRVKDAGLSIALASLNGKSDPSIWPVGAVYSDFHAEAAE
jgi:hypothetical protein